MILPGTNNKLIRFLSKFVPDKKIGKIVYKMEVGADSISARKTT